VVDLLHRPVQRNRRSYLFSRMHNRLAFHLRPSAKQAVHTHRQLASLITSTDRQRTPLDRGPVSHAFHRPSESPHHALSRFHSIVRAQTQTGNQASRKQAGLVPSHPASPSQLCLSNSRARPSLTASRFPVVALAGPRAPFRSRPT